MSCCKGHACSEAIQVVTATANLKLPDSAEIRDGKIKSITLRRLGSDTGLSATGGNLAADTVISTAHLTLINAKNVQVMKSMPLSLLQRDYNNPEPYQVNPDVFSGIDLSRSSITLDTGATGYLATDVIELIFEYDCQTNC